MSPERFVKRRSERSFSRTLVEDYEFFQFKSCCSTQEEQFRFGSLLDIDAFSHFIRSKTAHSFELGGAAEVQDAPDASSARMRSPVRGLNHSTE